MDDSKNVGGRDRLVRFGATVVLSILAVRWLRAGKRIRGLLAGVGALGFGFNATTGYCGVNDALDIDTAGEDDDVAIDFDSDAADADSSDAAAADDGDPVVVEAADSTAAEKHSLTCAVCDDPIRPGQRRGPNGQGDIVHDDCE
jgi:hypothetical protein